MGGVRVAGWVMVGLDGEVLDGVDLDLEVLLDGLLLDGWGMVGGESPLGMERSWMGLVGGVDLTGMGGMGGDGRKS